MIEGESAKSSNSVVGLKYDAYQTALFVGSVKIIYVQSIAYLNLVPPN